MTREEAIRCIEARMRADDVVYAADFYYPEALNMAIEALEEQEPRVMTLEEVLALGDDDFVFIETRLDGKTKIKPAIYQPDNSSDDEGDGYCCIVSSWGSSGFYHRENYNHSWRCWTSRPTDERREAVEWE